MVEALEINPFDSTHWLYGTGLTIYGGRDLDKWPSVSISSLADGIEEFAVKDLISPPGHSAPLLSAVLDVAGFIHDDLDTTRSESFEDPFWSSIFALDYAGLDPQNILRVGESNLATSSDGGKSWTLSFANGTEGSIAMAADASSIVWCMADNSMFIRNNAISQIPTLPHDSVVVSDKVDPKYFYAVDANSVYVSSNSGETFAAASNVTSKGAGKLAVHPAVAGDVWLSTGSGIYHSTDFGRTFTQSPGVESGQAIAVGKGPNNGTNVYAFAKMEGKMALRLSEDKGATWTIISNDQYGFGAAGANVLAASWETEGLVFVGTNGRGIFYGTPSGY